MACGHHQGRRTMVKRPIRPVGQRRRINSQIGAISHPIPIERPAKKWRNCEGSVPSAAFEWHLAIAEIALLAFLLDFPIGFFGPPAELLEHYCICYTFQSFSAFLCYSGVIRGSARQHDDWNIIGFLYFPIAPRVFVA